ncbi:MAG: PEP-CTERM sorting domain-containing protein [Planctomycetales bacterium]
MFKRLKWLGVVAVVALHLAQSREASAGLVFSGTVQQWLNISNSASNGVAVDDKLFKLTSASLSLLNRNVSLFHTGTHYGMRLDYNPPAGVAGPLTNTLAYTVTITDANFVFDDVFVDSTTAGTGVKVSKEIVGITTIVSTDGSIANTNLAAGQSSLSIVDTITVASAAGNIVNALNEFTQKSAHVPEPSSLLGMIGMAAVGLVARRRRTVAAREVV